ncbi:EF-hand domain-containing protein [archaeon]|nr:MAG: EF-hand domain-containing protein [archaeon]
MAARCALHALCALCALHPARRICPLRVQAWSVADKDGDGRVDASELGALMAQLAGGKPPAPDEAAKMLAKIDTNRDGVVCACPRARALTHTRTRACACAVHALRGVQITYHEFEAAMIKWLTEAEETPGGQARGTCSSACARGALPGKGAPS